MYFLFLVEAVTHVKRAKQMQIPWNKALKHERRLREFPPKNVAIVSCSFTKRGNYMNQMLINHDLSDK